MGYYDRWTKYIADNCSEFQNSLIYDFKVDFVPISAMCRYIYILSKTVDIMCLIKYNIIENFL